MDEFHQPSSLFSLHTWQIEQELLFKVAKSNEQAPEWVILPLIGVFVWVMHFTMIFLVKILTFIWNTYFRLKILHFFVEFRFVVRTYLEISKTQDWTHLDSWYYVQASKCTSHVERVSIWVVFVEEKSVFNTSATFVDFISKIVICMNERKMLRLSQCIKWTSMMSSCQQRFKNFQMICLLEEYLL